MEPQCGIRIAKYRRIAIRRYNGEEEGIGPSIPRNEQTPLAGWLVAWGLCECMLVGFFAVWILPCTLLQQTSIALIDPVTHATRRRADEDSRDVTNKTVKVARPTRGKTHKETFPSVATTKIQKIINKERRPTYLKKPCCKSTAVAVWCARERLKVCRVTYWQCCSRLYMGMAHPMRLAMPDKDEPDV